MGKSAYKEIRNTKVEITDNVGDTAFVKSDARKAIEVLVARLEDLNFNSLDSSGDPTMPNLAEKNVLLTGSTPFVVYSFKLTTKYATGEYFFEFVEEAPNVDLLS